MLHIFFYRFCTFFVVVFSDLVDGDGDDEKDGGTLSREDSGGFGWPKKKKAMLQPRGKGVYYECGGCSQYIRHSTATIRDSTLFSHFWTELSVGFC